MAHASEGDAAAPTLLSDWASPEDILQIRTLMAELENKHAAELQAVKRDLEYYKVEHQKSLYELSRTDEMRKLYDDARLGYDSVKAEREQWKEEKAMLMLKLEQVDLERQALATRGVSSSGSGGSGASSGGFTGGTVSVESVQSAALQRELQLLENLTRTERQNAELSSRLEIATTVELQSLAKFETKFRQETHYSQMLKNQLKTVEESLKLANTQLDSAAAEKQRVLLEADANHAAKCKEIELIREAHDAVQRKEREEHEAVVSELRTKLERATSEFADAEAELIEVKEDRAAKVHQLAASLTERKDGIVILLEEVEAELVEVRAELRTQTQRCQDLSRAQEQEREQHRQAIVELTEDKVALAGEKETLWAKLEDANEAETTLRLELTRCQEELHRVSGKLVAQNNAEERLLAIESEKKLWQVKATALRADLDAQKEHYEKLLRHANGAMELLQKHERKKYGELEKEYEILLARCDKHSKRAKKYKTGYAELMASQDKLVQRLKSCSSTAGGVAAAREGAESADTRGSKKVGAAAEDGEDALKMVLRHSKEVTRIAAMLDS